MEWIFAHGAYTVVLTSQLLTRSEISPIQGDPLARIFQVPAPPPEPDDADFSLTCPSSEAEIQFEHWSEDLLDELVDSNDSDDSDESDDEFDEGSFITFQVDLPNSDFI
ncbi:hypothetical protein R3P38DRAFT_2772141 [Favolaschia claudopus]|uniref:Uncharacterized protein n=1 Tax=Favolaschia claudopus TaxID=2862362 RepID=A0AAW0C7U5_9AGAR